MIIGFLNRISDNGKQTLGEIIFTDHYNGDVIYKCKSLELSWNNNIQEASCIPIGTYVVIKRWSAKYGYHFLVQNVAGRSWILIHSANYSRQLKGCIAVGEEFIDIDGDGLKDVTNSKNTLNTLYHILPQSFTLKIVNQNNENMKAKDIIKSIGIGVKEDALSITLNPFKHVKKNKEDDSLNPKNKLNIPRWMGNIISQLAKWFLAKKGIDILTDDQLDALINYLIGLMQ